MLAGPALAPLRAAAHPEHQVPSAGLHLSLGQAVKGNRPRYAALRPRHGARPGHLRSERLYCCTAALRVGCECCAGDLWCLACLSPCGCHCRHRCRRPPCAGPIAPRLVALATCCRQVIRQGGIIPDIIDALSPSCSAIVTVSFNGGSPVQVRWLHSAMAQGGAAVVRHTIVTLVRKTPLPPAGWPAAGAI